MNEVIRLWTDGPPPTTIDGVPPEVAYTVQDGVATGMTFFRNISDPTLTVFQPSEEAAKGVGIIVVPGGGWTINAWGHEGLDVATWLAGLGYTAFVLKYRLQPSPADDAEFETLMAAADQIHAGSVTYARKPRAISDIIATDAYLARIFRSGAWRSHENALRPGMIVVATQAVNPRVRRAFPWFKVAV